MNQLALNYFQAWNSQDADWLRRLLHVDVSLQDWEASADGIDEVILLNKGIWEKVPKITAELISIAESFNNERCMCQLLIHTGTETLEVVDVLHISNGVITNIKAYKG